MSTIIKSKIIRSLAESLGNMLIALQPKRAQKLSENRITLVHMNKNNLSIPERLMRYALVQKLDAIEDHQKIADLNRKFWEDKTAAELFKHTENKFESDFLPNCTFIFEMLRKILSKQSEKFNTIVEIGTGNGDVLNYLHIQFPKIERFIGIDLSAHQIELNSIKFKNKPTLEFVTSDAFEWVNKKGHDHTIFVTYSGVLEYFIEKRLQEFLININSLGKVIFIAIEPNGANHDFEKNPNTQIYGNEPSFSHNYPHLFKKAGFSLWHFSQKPCLQGGSLQTYVGAKNY
jgi:predicted TPR repeat methyltransferase